MRARGWTVSAVGGTLRVVPGLPVPVPPTATPAPATGRRPRRDEGACRSMKAGADQIALPLDWPQSGGRPALHPFRRQPRGVRSFPQMEHVAGQGDHPRRAAPLGPLLARPRLRRAGRRAPVRRCRARMTRKRCSTPGTRPRTPAGHWSWWSTTAPAGRRAAGPAHPAGGDPGGPHPASRRCLVHGADRTAVRRPRAAYSGRRPALHHRPRAPRLSGPPAGGRGGRPLRHCRARAAEPADGPPRPDRCRPDRPGRLSRSWRVRRDCRRSDRRSAAAG